MKSRIAPAAFILAALLAGCGQTGPLYLPKPPAKPATAGQTGVAPPSALPASNQK